MSLRKTAEFIRRHKRFLITSHVNPEADAIGSELAFLWFLRKIGKEGFIINESKVPVECLGFPGAGEIKQLPSHISMAGSDKQVKKIKGLINGFDCAVYLDCADGLRAGRVNELIPPGLKTVNIDHHISNKAFSCVNWVEPYASCTCEMIYRLCKIFRLELDINAALVIYAGIASDTGHFRYSNTTYLTHKIAAELIKKGLNPKIIHSMLFENNSFSDVRLLGGILRNINSCAGGKIIWADLSNEALKSGDLQADLSEEVLGLMRSIKGMELAIFFKAVLGNSLKLRVNFRSQGGLDCNRLASKFGGGGHKNASGASITGDFENIKKEVLSQANKLIKGMV